MCFNARSARLGQIVSLLQIDLHAATYPETLFDEPPSDTLSGHDLHTFAFHHNSLESSVRVDLLGSALVCCYCGESHGASPDIRLSQHFHSSLSYSIIVSPLDS